jgi:hypothetical protein
MELLIRKEFVGLVAHVVKWQGISGYWQQKWEESFSVDRSNLPALVESSSDNLPPLRDIISSSSVGICTDLLPLMLAVSSMHTMVSLSGVFDCQMMLDCESVSCFCPDTNLWIHGLIGQE